MTFHFRKERFKGTFLENLIPHCRTTEYESIKIFHIRQPKLAGQHYRLALEAAEKRPAGFDREQVRRRLGELQAAQQP